MIHNVSEWFGTTKLLEYYNTEFKSNVTGKFKFPRKILTKWLQDTPTPPSITDLQEKVINTIGEVAIQSITTSIVAKTILPKIPFSWLMTDTQHYLKQAVCEFILNAANNDQFFERLNGSTMTSSAFSLTQDTTNWLLQSDEIGIATKNQIDLSGIVHYEIVESDALWTEQNGNTYIVGSIDSKYIKELVI